MGKLKVGLVGIGRGTAYGNIFTKNPLTEVVALCDTNEEKLETAKTHIALICKYKGEYIGIKEARKHALWYVKGLKFAAQAKNDLSRANSLEEMNDLLERLFSMQI